MNRNLPNPDLDYEAPLELDLDESSLALHALRAYINMKGNEVSENTCELEQKLQTYIDRRLGGDKMIVEIDR
jgi:hypothetical protein